MRSSSVPAPDRFGDHPDQHPGDPGLVGIYTDPGHVIADPRAGLVRQPFAVCFHARPLSGSPGGDQVETSDARWFTIGDIGASRIRPAMRLRIGHALALGRPCHIG
jgi:hypothetical protein